VLTQAAGGEYTGVKKWAGSATDKPNTLEDISSYNNFYEFGTGKSDPAQNAHTLQTSPWTIEVTGEAMKTGKFTLEDIPYRTGGPARYVKVKETGGRLGFITPMTHNFCESCNRVRLTCTGTLYMCLGQDDAADLRAPLRASADDAQLLSAIDAAIARKPKGHDFIIDRRTKKPAVGRHMSVTGG